MSRALPERPRVNPLVAALARLWLLPKRWYLRRTRLGRTVLEEVCGRPFEIVPEVMNPVIFRTGRYFAEVLAESGLLDGPGDRAALDVGTGSGVLAVAAALRGYRVTAVDVSAEAVACAAANAARNGLSERITVHESDLFAAVAGQEFDLVLCSLPKFRGPPQNAFETSWRAEDVIERFAQGLPGALAENGLALVLLTTHGDDEGMLNALKASGLTVEPVEQAHFGVEIFTIYAVRHPAG